MIWTGSVLINDWKYSILLQQFSLTVILAIQNTLVGTLQGVTAKSYVYSFTWFKSYLNKILPTNISWLQSLLQLLISFRKKSAFCS